MGRSFFVARVGCALAHRGPAGGVLKYTLRCESRGSGSFKHDECPAEPDLRNFARIQPLWCVAVSALAMGVVGKCG